MALFLIGIVFFYRRKKIREPKIIGTVENIEEKEGGLMLMMNLKKYTVVYGKNENV